MKLIQNNRKHRKDDVMTISHNELLGLYRCMVKIRIFDEKLADIYYLEEMRTPVHFSIGQEAVAVGVCYSLKDDDVVFASHRSHAAYFAKGGSAFGMVAELYGKDTGVCKGRAGSAHLSDPEKNMFSAPIVGEMAPVAVGAALSFSMDKCGRVAVVFFGDAAIEEGVVLESINFAVLKRLPVIFVCENNFYSTHTHIRFRQPDIPIYKRVKGFGIESYKVDGNNVTKVYSLAKRLIGECRDMNGPFFLECVTYRYREHVGPNFDFYNPYRSKEEVMYWMKRCPIKRLERLLLSRQIVDLKEIDAIKEGINKEVEDAILYARDSNWPDKNTLTEDVY